MEKIYSYCFHFNFKMVGRTNAVFSNEELCFIVRKFGEGITAVQIRRAFRNEYHPKSPSKVPQISAFTRVLKRLHQNGSSLTRTPKGRPPTDLNQIQNVKQFFEENPEAHIREASETLQLSTGTIWNILRKKLKWKSYRIHKVQCLSPSNKESRLNACQFWLNFSEEWFERVIWTDEKWFVLKQAPNCHNDRYWAPANRHELVECKKAHGEKVMAWVGIVDGRCLPVVWFNGSVNGEVYLTKVLKETVWETVKHVATRRQYWFQQDGASCHVTAECLEFLRDKFGDNVISRNTAHHWPPYSPDLSPLDFSFWNQAMQHVRKQQPHTLQHLKRQVELFASEVAEQQLRSMARHVRKRAALCVQEKGSHFEHLL